MWRPFHSSSEAIFACVSWFQDHPLLAAPCRWDHHLCTDLKEEGKMIDDAVRRTRSRQVGNVVVCVGFGRIYLSTRDRERVKLVHNISFSPSFLE